MPCTTLLVGKKASYDGSTLMARNEDSGAGNFTPEKVHRRDPEGTATALPKRHFQGGN